MTPTENQRYRGGSPRLPAPGTGQEETAGVRTVDITLWPMAHRFARGHRIRLQVARGAHPPLWP
ncbi:CocE/NonD family hydrolase C-terminal non-catalytic domain-containing protein [Spongiactinospora sp. 9N601]|uniref:CocE/NonD family hydrolase C-terminal non-catalytic domain-containing protein n=1 Tax=Spongiactinospora sp. 9N601 TaxID=3375149 RepID=UPI00378CC329